MTPKPSTPVHVPRRPLVRWLLPALVALSVAGCGAAPAATPTPAPKLAATTAPAATPSPAATPAGAGTPAPAATKPAGVTTPGTTPALTPAPAATKPAAEATTSAGGATPATTPTRPVGGSTPAAAATPALARAELWQVDGQPVMQVAITGERRFVVTTGSVLYGVAGEQVERRATNGPWPNLMAVNETILLSGDKMACARGDGGAPLRRSVDGGRTWQTAQATGAQGGLMARPVPTLGADLFAVACDGLFRSTDSGATWQRLAILEPDHEVIDLATTPAGDTLYMVALFGEGGTTRVLASERDGQTWGPVRSLRESWGGGVITVSMEQGRETIYFGSPLGMWVSREAGARWQALNQGLDSTILLADPRAGALPPAEQAKLQRAVGLYSLAADLNQFRVLLGGSDGVYLLQREGTWRKLPVLENQLVREVFTDLQGQAYARTDTGVHRLRGV